MAGDSKLSSPTRRMPKKGGKKGKGTSLKAPDYCVDQFGVPPSARLVTPSGVMVTVAGMGVIDEKLYAMFPGGFLQPLGDEAGDPVSDLEEMLGAGYRLDRRYVREMVHILDGRKVFDPKMPVSRVRAGAQVMRGVHACVSQRLMLPAPRRRSRRCRRHFRKAPG